MCLPSLNSSILRLSPCLYPLSFFRSSKLFFPAYYVPRNKMPLSLIHVAYALYSPLLGRCSIFLCLPAPAIFLCLAVYSVLLFAVSLFVCLFSLCLIYVLVAFLARSRFYVTVLVFLAGNSTKMLCFLGAVFRNRPPPFFSATFSAISFALTFSPAAAFSAISFCSSSSSLVPRMQQ